MKPTIIGISGRKGSFKSTFSRTLAENLSEVCFHVSFAEPIKRLAEDISGIKMICEPYGAYVNPVLDFAREDKDRVIPGLLLTIGEFMQELGEGFRESHEPIWVDTAFRKINKALEKNYLVIVSDVRYQNEANRIINNGGIVIRLEGSNDDSRYALHESEVDLDGYEDFSYTTTITEDNLQSEVEKVMGMFGFESEN